MTLIKNPRPLPGPLLSQGVNSPEVSGELGAGKPTGLSSLIRAAGKPGSLDEVAGESPGSVVTKKDTP